MFHKDQSLIPASFHRLVPAACTVSRQLCYSTEKTFFPQSNISRVPHTHTPECILSDKVIFIRSDPHLLLSPQRALSPRAPASGCRCLEASNNCSSPPPSLFASYRGSAPICLTCSAVPRGGSGAAD